MKHGIKKEFLYGLRNSRFLILFISFLFFALLTPITMKLILPALLQSQFPGMTDQLMAEMINMTQLGCMQSYMGDIFEIGSIIVAFTLCDLMAQDIKENTLVLPLCAGKQFGSIIGAKILVFGIVLFTAPLVSLLADYFYAGLLFSFDIGLRPIIRAGLLQGVYMSFLLVSLIMWGSITKKPLATGAMSLATVFGLHFMGSIFGIHNYLPSGLLDEAQKFTIYPANSLIQTIFITLGLIILFAVITLFRLKNLEWNER